MSILARRVSQSFASRRLSLARARQTLAFPSLPPPRPVLADDSTSTIADDKSLGPNPQRLVIGQIVPPSLARPVHVTRVDSQHASIVTSQHRRTPSDESASLQRSLIIPPPYEAVAPPPPPSKPPPPRKALTLPPYSIVQTSTADLTPAQRIAQSYVARSDRGSYRSPAEPRRSALPKTSVAPSRLRSSAVAPIRSSTAPPAPDRSVPARTCLAALRSARSPPLPPKDTSI